jgi:leucyl aminopeptidase (aminopeptidase T)
MITVLASSLLFLGTYASTGSADNNKLNGTSKTADTSKKKKVDEDKVLITFSTVGDSRVDDTVKDLPAQDYKWTVNTKVMSRMLKEIEAQKSKLFFFNGDMIRVTLLTRM